MSGVVPSGCLRLRKSVSICEHLWLKLADQIKEELRPHRDQPRRVVFAVGNNPRQLLGVSRLRLVAFGLNAGIGEVQVLHALHLEVQPCQRIADHVGGIRGPGKLLATSRIKTMLAQQRCELPFAYLAFVSGIHISGLGVFKGGRPQGRLDDAARGEGKMGMQMQHHRRPVKHHQMLHLDRRQIMLLLPILDRAHRHIQPGRQILLREHHILSPIQRIRRRHLA